MLKCYTDAAQAAMSDAPTWCNIEMREGRVKPVELSATQYRKTPRDQYLPRASVLEKMSHHDRAAALACHRRRLEGEVARQVLNTCVGRRQFLKSARARMNRLERLEHSSGIRLDDSDRRAA